VAVGTVNVGTGVGTSLIELAELIETVSGKTLPLEFAQTRGVDVDANVLDISALRQVLGDVNLRDLGVGLQQTWASFVE
jgi:UDP-glucose 4-epimerase